MPEYGETWGAGDKQSSQSSRPITSAAPHAVEHGGDAMKSSRQEQQEVNARSDNAAALRSCSTRRVRVEVVLLSSSHVHEANARCICILLVPPLVVEQDGAALVAVEAVVAGDRLEHAGLGRVAGLEGWRVQALLCADQSRHARARRELRVISHAAGGG